MTSELPRFLQLISLRKSTLTRPAPAGDSHPEPALAEDPKREMAQFGEPTAGPGSAASALPPALPLGTASAAPAKPGGIFHSRPPVLLRGSAEAATMPPAPAPTAPPSAEASAETASALERARSLPATGRIRRSAGASAADSSKPLRIMPAPPAAPPSELRILSLPRLAQGGRWRTEAMRSYAVPLLLWFTKGQGRITLAGVTRGFGAHTCIYLPPGTMHGFEVASQVFGSAVFFASGTDLCLPDEPVHLRFRDGTGHGELTQMIDAMQRELDGNRPARARALEHHAGLLSVWLERQVEAQTLPSALTETGARRLSAAYAALVEKRFRDGLAVADFAAELGVTATHLTRSCNAACGRSAHDVLSDRIFYQARKELAESKLPIQEIAKGLGFTSAAYFTRAFQKATGQTPTAFRAISAL